MSGPGDTVEDASERSLPMTRRLSLLGPTESRVKRWVLLRGNRMVLSASMLLGVFLALLATSVLWPLEMQDLLTETATVQTLLNTLLSGIILLVSVVVSINSIVLSQDITSLDTQQERVESTMEFRSAVEEVAEIDVCPTEPAKLLRIQLQTVIRCVGEFHDLTDEAQTKAFREDMDEYHHQLDGYTRLVFEKISDVDSDSIEVLIAGLSYDYAGAIHASRELEAKHDDQLSADQHEALESIVESLKLFSIGHEHYKSLFYMREFGKLSKALLYVALPVIVLVSYVQLAISAGQYPGIGAVVPGSVPISSVTVFVMAAYSVALAPYLVLTAFVLRSATVATRSLAAGPMLLQRE